MENQTPLQSAEGMQKKKNWPLIISVIIVTLVQLASLGMIAVGWLVLHFATEKTQFIQGIHVLQLFLIIPVLFPLPFWLHARKKGNGRSFFVNFIISFLSLVFALYLQGVIPLSSEKKAAMQAQRDSKFSIRNYQAISKKLVGRKIVGWVYSREIPPQNTHIMQTDHDWSIYINVPYNDAVVEYINKNILGGTFDVVLPPYTSSSVPISFYSNAVCNCDLLVNGQPLTPILEKVYQDSQSK